MSRLRNLGLAVAAGFALFASFPDLGLWFLAPFSIATLFVAISRSSGKGAFGLGWAFGVAFFLPHLEWLEFAVGWIPWLALSLWSALYVGLACMLFAHANHAGFFTGKPWLAPIVFAFLWVGAELLRSWVPFGGFPWGRLAFGAVDAPLVKLAVWGGAPLVSFAVALAGALLGLAAIAWVEKRPVSALAAVLLTFLIFLLPLGVPLDTRAEQGTLAVGWAQGNVPNEGLDSFQQARLVTTNHVQATRLLAAELDRPLDLTIWPENSVDFDPRVDEPTAADVTAAARAINTPIIIGTADYSVPKGRYNVSMVWMPNGAAGGQYRKQQPAAFAEYIPIRGFARLFSPEVDRVTRDMVPGTEPAFIDVEIESLDRVVRVGTIICFEVAYDWVSREAAAQDAEFWAVQTNNATFGVTAESTQQLAMTRFRAIETGKAALQVSTVGVSAVVTPEGKVLESTELFTQAYGHTDVPLRTSITPAVAYGQWITWGFALIAVGLACGAVYVRMRDSYEW